jgi:hypothetical protein
VIEDRRGAVGGDKDGDSAANNQGFGVIDLESIAIDERDSERAKRAPSLIGLQSSIKLFGSH